MNFCDRENLNRLVSRILVIVKKDQGKKEHGKKNNLKMFKYTY